MESKESLEIRHFRSFAFTVGAFITICENSEMKCIFFWMLRLIIRPVLRLHILLQRKNQNGQGKLHFSVHGGGKYLGRQARAAVERRLAVKNS